MLYIYTCSSKKGCGHTFDRSMSVDDWKSKIRCPKCNKMAYQNLLAQHSSGGIDSQMIEYQFEGDTGTRPYAASYLMNQKTEAHKKHPGTDFREHGGCYMPVIKNKTHYKKYLREMNFVEF